MKTAYELAMERLARSSPSQPLTEAQKRELADLDARYLARIAEREITLKGAIDTARAEGRFDEAGKLERQLADERQRIQSELEEKKEAVRTGKG